MRPIALAILTPCVLAGVLVLGCAAGDEITSLGAEDVAPPPGELFAPKACPSGQVVCDGGVAHTCDGRGGFSDSADCGAQGKTCADGYGCVACVPFTEGTCQDGVATMCGATGEGTVTFACDTEQGMTCAPDGCRGACSPMELGGSYIGCDYWPTVTWNGVLRQWFHFAAAVANASPEVAHVKVTRGDLVIAETEIPPGSLDILELPWVSQLKGQDSGSGVLIALPYENVLVNEGAYRLRSDRPVTVYQFNALEYQNTQAPTSTSCTNMSSCCPDVSGTGGCFSYSNDASLLLPTTSLGSSYVAMGYRSVRSGLAVMFDSLAITATEPDTQVAIQVTTNTVAGGGLPALQPGQTGTLTLGAGDVLELLSGGTSLSGSRVWSPNGKPFQLLSTMPAAELPDGVHAADHIEETVLPASALGKDYVVSVPTTPLGKRIQTVRIQPVADATELSFDPPNVHEPVTIDAWETLEIVGVDEDFRVVASAPIGVTQYMHGQGLGPQQEGAAGAGDPAQGLAVPTQQFRSSYIFLAPSDYDTNYVNIVAQAGVTVTLDGAPIPADELTPVGESGMAVARHVLAPTQVHEIHADAPFGILVYGYGQYTAYMYPGGLDVKPIANVPTPK